MGIYTLRVKCVCLGDDCIRVIEIPEDSSLRDLHEAIQEAVEFDNDHLYEFFMARNERSGRIRFTDQRGSWEYVAEPWHKIVLNRIWPLNGLKLYYLFDFGDDWLFEIRKRPKVKEREPGVKYPRVVEKIGDNPEQYPIWDEEIEEDALLPTNGRSLTHIMGEEIGISHDLSDSSEIPPLNEYAEIILEAMKEAGEPLSKNKILKRTGTTLSKWSEAYALLVAHDLILSNYNKRGWEVFSCKGEDGGLPDVEQDKPKEPSPPLSSMPFFGMEGEIDWGEEDN